MAGFEVELQGFEELARRLRDPGLVAGPARRFLTDSALELEAAVKERTPVDTARLRDSITHEVDAHQVPEWARVGTNVDYARPVEEGRRPHWPPLAALQPWARRHGFPAGRAGAFLVARAIAARGTKARHMFRDGFREVRGQVEGFGRDMLRELVDKLAGGSR